MVFPFYSLIAELIIRKKLTSSLMGPSTFYLINIVSIHQLYFKQGTYETGSNGGQAGGLSSWEWFCKKSIIIWRTVCSSLSAPAEYRLQKTHNTSENWEKVVHMQVFIHCHVFLCQVFVLNLDLKTRILFGWRTGTKDLL